MSGPSRRTDWLTAIGHGFSLMWPFVPFPPRWVDGGGDNGWRDPVQPDGHAGGPGATAATRRQAPDGRRAFARPRRLAVTVLVLLATALWGPAPADAGSPQEAAWHTTLVSRAGGVAYLQQLPGLRRIVILGGAAVVSPMVADQLRAQLADGG
jgi:hypothetical protein